MSLGAEDVKKTEELPGAFPSEDAITKSELNDTTSSSSSGIPSQSQSIAHTAAAGSGTTASPAAADSDPDHLLRRAGAEGVPPSKSSKPSAQQQPGSSASAADPLSGPAVAKDDGFGAENAPDITGDLKAVGSGAATAATAAAIAARDAAVAVKDAAAPVVSAASEQVGRPLTYSCMVD